MKVKTSKLKHIQRSHVNYVKDTNCEWQSMYTLAQKFTENMPRNSPTPSPPISTISRIPLSPGKKKSGSRVLLGTVKMNAFKCSKDDNVLLK